VYKSQDKESELVAINDLLSSPLVNSESLTLFCHRHPSIISQLQPNSDQQQQPTCDKSNIDRCSKFLADQLGVSYWLCVCVCVCVWVCVHACVTLVYCG